MIHRPKHLHLDREKGLTVEWSDGTRSFYPVAYLRKMSPSADMRELREQLRQNPLTVLPQRQGAGAQPLRIEQIEPIGNYAVRLVFSDGHATGLYSWDYLHQIAEHSSTTGSFHPAMQTP